MRSIGDRQRGLRGQLLAQQQQQQEVVAPGSSPQTRSSPSLSVRKSGCKHDGGRAATPALSLSATGQQVAVAFQVLSCRKFQRQLESKHSALPTWRQLFFVTVLNPSITESPLPVVKGSALADNTGHDKRTDIRTLTHREADEYT
ncbi:hypothetical protein AAFF_G00260670 [Aldrovandia affinis]|uniref:Uncharacterized protein n=1 Tax=Aldrovandia affinis TaxID=143900 RepID=A0AAD7W3B2_9TELE|nr:hypothetical protein AAFF_G00260670 [Aldrovandia affinis]